MAIAWIWDGTCQASYHADKHPLGFIVGSIVGRALRELLDSRLRRETEWEKMMEWIRLGFERVVVTRRPLNGKMVGYNTWNEPIPEYMVKEDRCSK
jgi:hypothetical protein